MEHKRSLFWPLFLIAAGVVWLLISAGMIPSQNLWALTRIWPFLLIAAGVGLILRSVWKYSYILLDIIVVGGALLAVIYASQLGWARPPITMFGFDGPFVGFGEQGSGHIVTETREVSGFHAIEVDYPAQVFVKPGVKESLKIEADDNVMPELKTEVRNGVLKISFKRPNPRYVNPTEPVKITVVVKELDDVEFTSAGELIIDDIESDELDVSISGAGNLELNEIQTQSLHVSLSGAGSMSASGETDKLDVNISGLGDFKGRQLHSQDALVSISGAGSATVWTDDNLTAQVSGAGSVDYYGSPDVNKQISGLGGVNHKGDK
ncbi:MAG TPA: DUF2807 domain-containing protein [Anaerolineales bacterium]|nr:DUF2807 domain-containing protein [Anaerolineales bacterium]